MKDYSRTYWEAGTPIDLASTIDFLSGRFAMLDSRFLFYRREKAPGLYSGSVSAGDGSAPHNQAGEATGRQCQGANDG